MKKPPSFAYDPDPYAQAAIELSVRLSKSCGEAELGAVAFGALLLSVGAFHETGISRAGFLGVAAKLFDNRREFGIGDTAGQV